MHLYAGKTLLAVARIPLSSLATVTTITDEYPLIAEGATVAMDAPPLVAVVVSLTTEVSLLPGDDNKPLPLATALNSDDDDESSKSSHSSINHSNGIKSARRSLSDQFNMVTMETTNQPSSKCSSPTSSLSISHTQPLPSDHVHTSPNQQLVTALANQKQTSPANQSQVPNSSNVLSADQVKTNISTNHIGDQTEQPHHFCVTIDVRSLRLLVDHMSNSQLTGRYSYPFFGTSQSVILPAIKPLPYMECSFDQSYCAFDFATPRGVLVTQLNSVPLVIELLEPNSSVVAMATLMMSVLVTQPVQTMTGGVHRQCYDSKVAVVARLVFDAIL